MPARRPAARWVALDSHHRADAIRGWGRLVPAARPDVVAVSVGEHGWRQVCAAAHAHGMGLELGIWTPADAVTLRRAGIPPGVVRLVAEVTIGDPTLALTEADRILRALDPLDISVLLHGEDAASPHPTAAPPAATRTWLPTHCAAGHDRGLDYGLTRRPSYVFDACRRRRQP